VRCKILDRLRATFLYYLVSDINTITDVMNEPGVPRLLLLAHQTHLRYQPLQLLCRLHVRRTLPIPTHYGIYNDAFNFLANVAMVRLRAGQADNGSDVPKRGRENPGKDLAKGLALATHRAVEPICRAEHRPGVVLRDYVVLVGRQIFKD
jgi:hypothetical protein